MKTDPTPQTLLQGKPWTPSHQTDVQKTWRQFGWAPSYPTPPAGNGPTYPYKGARDER